MSKIYSCVRSGKRGYKWGPSGECYTYDDANQTEAAAKARAIADGLESYSIRQRKNAEKELRDLNED